MIEVKKFPFTFAVFYQAAFQPQLKRREYRFIHHILTGETVEQAKIHTGVWFKEDTSSSYAHGRLAITDTLKDPFLGTENVIPISDSELAERISATNIRKLSSSAIAAKNLLYFLDLAPEERNRLLGKFQELNPEHFLAIMLRRSLEQDRKYSDKGLEKDNIVFLNGIYTGDTVPPKELDVPEANSAEQLQPACKELADPSSSYATHAGNAMAIQRNQAPGEMSDEMWSAYLRFHGFANEQEYLASLPTDPNLYIETRPEDLDPLFEDAGYYAVKTVKVTPYSLEQNFNIPTKRASVLMDQLMQYRVIWTMTNGDICAVMFEDEFTALTNRINICKKIADIKAANLASGVPSVGTVTLEELSLPDDLPGLFLHLEPFVYNLPVNDRPEGGKEVCFEMEDVILAADLNDLTLQPNNGKSKYYRLDVCWRKNNTNFLEGTLRFLKDCTHCLVGISMGPEEVQPTLHDEIMKLLRRVCRKDCVMATRTLINDYAEGYYTFTLFGRITPEG